MTNSYDNKFKCFIKRMCNRLLGRAKMLDAPVEYSQKEIKLKSEEIVYFLSTRFCIF